MQCNVQPTPQPFIFQDWWFEAPPNQCDLVYHLPPEVWILYSQVYICIKSTCTPYCIVYDNWWYTLPAYGVRIGESQQGRHLPAAYLARPSRASQTLWPGRTGSALAWLKMLINREIEEEEPNLSPLLFQQLVQRIFWIWPMHFILESFQNHFRIHACSLRFLSTPLWKLICLKKFESGST